MQFFDSSPKAVQMRKGRQPGEKKYPWSEVPVGKSFVVQRNDIKFEVLRSLASRTGKKLGKKFRVVDHGSGPYEVACLPMSEQQAVASSDNIVDALKKAGAFDDNGNLKEKE